MREATAIDAPVVGDERAESSYNGAGSASISYLLKKCVEAGEITA